MDFRQLELLICAIPSRRIHPGQRCRGSLNHRSLNLVINTNRLTPVIGLSPRTSFHTVVTYRTLFPLLKVVEAEAGMPRTGRIV